MSNTRTLADLTANKQLNEAIMTSSYSVRTLLAEEFLTGITITPNVREPLIELLTQFDNQGHSGFSAGFGISSTLNILSAGYRKLRDQEEWDWLTVDDEDRFRDPALEGSEREVLNVMGKRKLSLDEMRLLLKYFKCITKQLPLGDLTGEEWEWVGEQNRRSSIVFRNKDYSYHLEGVYFHRYNGSNGWSSPLGSMKVDFPYDGQTYMVTVIEDEHGLIEDPQPIGENVVVGDNVFTPKREFYKVVEVLENGDVRLENNLLEDRVIPYAERFEIEDFSYENANRSGVKTVSFKVAKWSKLKNE